MHTNCERNRQTLARIIFKTLRHTMQSFNFQFCACHTRSIVVPFLYGTEKFGVDAFRFRFLQHITCDFLSSCIAVFIHNLRVRNHEYTTSISYLSQQRLRTRFPVLWFPYQQLFIRILRDRYSCIQPQPQDLLGQSHSFLVLVRYY